MSHRDDPPAVRRTLTGAPRLPSWLLARPRVVAAIATPAALTVVRAPAGGGKTTAVLEWVHGATGPDRGVWVAADPTRRTRGGFWSQALALVEDSGIAPPGSVLAQGVDALRESSDVPGLLARGFGQVGPCTLVVDGADHLDDEVVADLVTLTTMPGLHVVVTVRSGEPFLAADVRLRTDVHVVDADQLVLDLTEAAEVLGLDPAAAATVHAETGGLPLAVRLARLGADGDLDPDDAAVVLLRSVTDALDADTVAFLRSTAVADQLDPTLAVALLQADGATPTEDDAAVRLDRVEALGLGAWYGSGPTATFRYTSVVRTAVRAWLAEQDPARYARLRRIVAVWCDRTARPAAGVQAAVDADDLGLAQAIVVRHWRDVMAFHIRAVARATEPVGLRRLRRYPVILFFLALAANADPHRRRQALVLFGLALTAARVQRPRAEPAQQMILRAIEVVALRVAGQTQALAPAARALARQVAGLDLADRDAYADLVPVVHSHTGLAFLYTGHADEAIEQFHLGLAAARTPAARLHNLACLAGVLALTGEITRARELLADSPAAQWPEGWLTGYQGALHQLAGALVALEQFDVATAERHLEVLAPHAETIEHWPLIAHTRAMVDLAAGRGVGALERFDATRRRHAERRSSDTLGDRLDVTRRVLLVAAGRPGPARTTARQPRSTRTAAAVADARAQLVAGAPDVALATLAAVADRAEPAPRVRAEHALLEAAALVELDRPDAAATALSTAAAVLAVHGLRLPLMLLRRRDRTALRELAVARGLTEATQVLTDHDVPDVVPEASTVPVLTPREAVVLRTLARTGSAAEIAEALHVSTHTVKSQLRTLYRKLGARSREDALASARHHGLLEADGLTTAPDG